MPTETFPGDYHLRDGSPAIDAGLSTGAPTTDFDGDARPLGGGVDIGLDEAAGAGPPPPPPPPPPPGLGCNSTVTDLEGLQSEVNHLATSAHTITSLTKTLESVAAAVNSGDHETARSQISTFVQKAVKHSLRSEKNGGRILVSQTNSLVCGAANVLSGLSLP